MLRDLPNKFDERKEVCNRDPRMVEKNFSTTEAIGVQRPGVGRGDKRPGARCAELVSAKESDNFEVILKTLPIPLVAA